MDISFSNVSEINLIKSELPLRDYITIVVKYDDGREQEIELTGREDELVKITFA